MSLNTNFIEGFLNWSLGFLFAFCGLILFSTAGLYSIITLLIAFLFIPPSYRYISSKLNLNLSKKARYVIIVVLFFVSISAYPKTNINEIKQKNDTNLEINTSTVNRDSSVKSSIVEVKVTPTATPTPTPIPTVSPTSTPIPTVIPPTSVPIIYNPPSIQSPQTNSSSENYSCSCSKVCGAMTSCDEAYFQLNTCGCSARDGDHDGVPCETICSGG